MSAAWASDGDVGLGPFSSRASSKGDTRSKDYECAYETVAVAVHGYEREERARRERGAKERRRREGELLKERYLMLNSGPIVLMRVELGAFNKGKLSNSVVLSMRLNNLQIQEVS